MASATIGSWVWYDHEHDGWLPCQVIESSADSVTIKSEIDEHFTVKGDKKLDTCHPASLDPVDNMVNLVELSEGAILHNLRVRYQEDAIYTYISQIVVSINPYKLLSCYGPKAIAHYRQVLAANGTLPPHVYTLADNSFKSLIRDNRNQSVIISGESGAGKTEATKLILQYLADCSGKGDDIEQQILAANPIVEAFGNAKTVRNNNSSRFGKLIEILFNNQNQIIGSQVTNYLLEKSRVMTQALGERNYHVFYQLVAGASDEEKKMFGLEDASQYRILRGGECFHIPHVDDASEYAQVRNSMDLLKFEADEIEDIFRVIAIVLHMGNIEFKDGGRENSVIENDEELMASAALLECDAKQLETALTTRKIKVVRDIVQTDLTKEGAENNRDAFCMALYDRTFNRIIELINRALRPPQQSNRLIGVLDIFGFEIFELNYFEQLCINFANEKLQQHFTHHVFTMEQAEYKAEGVTVPRVDFVDNQICVDLIEKNGSGILAMVAEELQLPKGSNDNLLERMNQSHKDHDYFVKCRTRKPIFGVKHYAGEVTYQIENFMEKNRDTLNKDLAMVVGSSSNEFLEALFADVNAPAEETGTRRRKKVVTLGVQFKNQLQQLMTKLNATDPHFIRCVKPNHNKVPDEFDGKMVSRQLKYLGLAEVISIRKLGYSIRKLHNEFVNRYGMLLAGGCPKGQESKVLAQRILEESKVHVDDWRIGSSKVFLRAEVQTALEISRENRLAEIVVGLQARARAKNARKQYLKIKSVLSALQVAVDAEQLEEIDKYLEECDGLPIPTGLLLNARQVRFKLHEILVTKQALSSCVGSKDLDLISSTISNAEANQFFDASWAEYAAAVQLRDTLVQYVQDMKTAMEARDKDGIQTCLNKAAQLGLNFDLEISARELLSVLRQEEAALNDVAEAMKARELSALNEAISKAHHLNIDRNLLADAHALQDLLRQEADMLAQLQAALDSKDLDLLSSSIDAVVQANLLTGHPIIQQAEELKAELIRQGAERKASGALEAAISTRNVNLLRSAISQTEGGQTLSGPMADLLASARALLSQLETEQQVSERLTVAMEDRNLDKLTAALRWVQDNVGHSANRMPIVQEAKDMKETIEEAQQELDAAAASGDSKKLDQAVSRAKHVGLGSSLQVQSIQKKRNSFMMQPATVNMLLTAINSGDDQYLASAIESAKKKGLPEQHPMQQRARNVLKKLQQEDVLEQQEIACATRAVEEAKAEEEGVASFSINISPVNVGEERKKRHARRDTQFELREQALRTAADLESKHAEAWVPTQQDHFRARPVFNANVYMDKKYQFHLYPGLRAPATYAASQLFNVKQLKASMLVWTKDLIPTSLGTIHKAQNVSIAIQNFKALQGFMLDRAYSFPDALAAGLLKSCLEEKLIKLRDELYLHLMKQTTDNPTAKSLKRGWQMFALTAETFPPSPKLLPFVYYHLLNQPQDTEVYDIVQYTLTTLQLNLDPAEHPPTIEHVSSFRDRIMQTQDVPIQFPDGSSILLPVDPSLDVAALISIICQKINLTDSFGFGIFHSHSQGDYLLQDGECVLDFPAAKALGDEKKSQSAYFIFKKFMFPRRGRTDDDVALNILYHQAVRDVCSGFLPCSREDQLKVLAIHRQLKGEHFRTPVGPIHEGMQRVRNLTLLTLDNDERMSFVRDLTTTQQNLDASAGPTDVISSVRRYPTYGAHMFSVCTREHIRSKKGVDLPLQMVLAVNLVGVFLLDPTNMKALKKFKYAHIQNWASNTVKFVVRVLIAKGQSAQYQFYTAQGKRVDDLVRAHINLLVQQAQNK